MGEYKRNALATTLAVEKIFPIPANAKLPYLIKSIIIFIHFIIQIIL